MKKIFLLVTLMLLSSIIFAVDVDPNWDGFIECKIMKLDVTEGNQYGIRVLTDQTDLLNDTNTTHDPISWAFLNENDSNYKTYVALLSLAFTMDYKVKIYVKEVPYGSETSYAAHIGYLSVIK